MIKIKNGVRYEKNGWTYLSTKGTAKERGYANGLITMEPNTVIQYFVDSPYSPQHEKSMLYSSVEEFDKFVKNYTENPHLSEKDRDGFLWENYRKTL